MGVMVKDKIDRETALVLRDKRIEKVPRLTNKEAARDATKPKTKRTDIDSDRAIILNFSRHSEPEDTMELLGEQYKNIRLFRPIEEKGLYIVDNVGNTKYNPLVTNPVERTVKTKSQQIHDWLYTYLTTKRENGLYPLDSNGDYYLVLPHKDAQISLEILTSLNGIKNTDWFIIWSTYNEHKGIFTISEIVSTKGLYDSWKKVSTEVSDIANRRKHKLLSDFSELETTHKKQVFINNLSDEDYSLIEYALSRRVDKGYI